jgi:FlaA1/EpsC-like NDP-sugar epimerase
MAAATAFRPTQVRVPQSVRRRADHAAAAGDAVREGQSPAAVVRRDTHYRRALAAADALSAAVAIALAVVVLGDDALSPAVVVPVFLVVIVGKVMGLYDRDEHLIDKTTLDEAPKLFSVATLYTLLIWLGQPLLVEGNLGRDQVVGLWALLALSMLTGRTFARYVVRTVAVPERCLVIGEASSAERAREKLESRHSINAVIVGRVPFETDPSNHSALAVLGNMEDLRPVLVEHDIHRAIVAPGTSDSDEILDVMRLVKSLGVKVSVLPRLFEVVGSSVEFDDI